MSFKFRAWLAEWLPFVSPLRRQVGIREPDEPRFSLADFLNWLRAIQNARVLELGTRRSNPAISTIRRDWAAADATYVKSDFQSGLDVDVIADIHKLVDSFEKNSFDAVIACSVFEHVQRPWIAAEQIAAVLKLGGHVFVQTHFAFPLHGHPNDYWRFTREALETIFEDANLQVLSAYYEFPCQVVSKRDPAVAGGPAYLNSCVIAEKR